VSSEPGPGDADLEEEARVFGRYLVGRLPTRELIERYRAANQQLLTGPVPKAEASLLAFVARNPWSVSFLDAATGLLRPASLLRSKVLVMAGILETSPDFADEFLPRRSGRLALVLRLAGLGTLALVRFGVGALLLVTVARDRT
jgi:hypothetical protein